MGTVVYRDATVFDGTGAAPVPGRSLVVEDDRLTRVVATDEARPARGCRWSTSAALT